DASLFRAAFLLFRFLAGLAHFGLEFGLELIGALVLGQQRPHLLEGGEALLGGLGAFELGLGLQVLRRQVGRHGRAPVWRRASFPAIVRVESRNSSRTRKNALVFLRRIGFSLQ